MAGEEQIELLTEHYEDFLDCARYGEEESIDEYLAHKVDVNWSDEFGITAMHRGMFSWLLTLLFLCTTCHRTQHVQTGILRLSRSSWTKGLF
mgnify:CR=1 FL=1